MHFSCFDSYYASVLSRSESQMDMMLDTDRMQFDCPLCKRLSNLLVPAPASLPPPAPTPTPPLTSASIPSHVNSNNLTGTTANSSGLFKANNGCRKDGELCDCLNTGGIDFMGGVDYNPQLCDLQCRPPEARKRKTEGFTLSTDLPHDSVPNKSHRPETPNSAGLTWREGTGANDTTSSYETGGKTAESSSSNLIPLSDLDKDRDDGNSNSYSNSSNSSSSISNSNVSSNKNIDDNVYSSRGGSNRSSGRDDNKYEIAEEREKESGKKSGIDNEILPAWVSWVNNPVLVTRVPVQSTGK